MLRRTTSTSLMSFHATSITCAFIFLEIFLIFSTSFLFFHTTLPSSLIAREVFVIRATTTVITTTTTTSTSTMLTFLWIIYNCGIRFMARWRFGRTGLMIFYQQLIFCSATRRHDTYSSISSNLTLHIVIGGPNKRLEMWKMSFPTCLH